MLGIGMANGEQPQNERRHDTGDVLVMRAREDGNSFILLYDIFYEKIFRYCFINLRVKQVAEDITSIVFIRAAENARYFKGKTRRQFVEWVYGIAEAQLKIYLKKTNLENRDNEQIEIDPTHKERLRAKVVVAYEQGQMKKNKIVIYSIAAVFILISLFILISISSKQQSTVSTEKPKLKPIPEQSKPAKIIERKAVQEQSEADEPETEEDVEKEAEPNIALQSEPNQIEPNQILATEKPKAVEGIRVEGRVVDWQQRPLQAVVTKGPYPKESADRVECDPDGHFAFDAIETGVGVFTAQCEGASPAILPVEIKEGMQPILIVLEQPNTIAGQIIDIQGGPIAGITIQATGWRGINSLVYSTITDAQGYFQWNSAPADEVLFSLRKNGYMSTYNYPMQTGVDYKLTMLPPIKMHGNLISAEPTMQIESFIMTVGYFFEPDKISWLDANSVIFSGSSYEMNITEPYEFKLKVQAEGFKTAESPTFNTAKMAFDYDFIMRKE
jgi:hypothetical protein